ncbi:receptor activity-modifying protein 1-like [Megalops cyprinoides]|uniref:receptor activity-modifying protein 1-like n=1 Tax=Megalops cyprinoides TaxID=118141 RepID=UPI0018656B4F|nr:receptor activity-modifying protein 1-like [Megalops cyprinoides]
MTAILNLVLFQVLFWGGTQQTNVTLQEDEAFQNEEHSHIFHCNETLLRAVCQYCELIFYSNIFEANESWCDWNQILRPYYELTVCMETWATRLNCFYPNHIVQEAFLQVHASYFQHCPDQDQVFKDAPHGVVLTLTLVPVCIIPILVFLVVWKSKVRD